MRHVLTTVRAKLNVSLERGLKVIGCDGTDAKSMLDELTLAQDEALERAKNPTSEEPFEVDSDDVDCLAENDVEVEQDAEIDEPLEGAPAADLIDESEPLLDDSMSDQRDLISHSGEDSPLEEVDTHAEYVEKASAKEEYVDAVLSENDEQQEALKPELDQADQHEAKAPELEQDEPQNEEVSAQDRDEQREAAVPEMPSVQRKATAIEKTA